MDRALRTFSYRLEIIKVEACAQPKFVRFEQDELASVAIIDLVNNSTTISPVELALNNFSKLTPIT